MAMDHHHFPSLNGSKVRLQDLQGAEAKGSQAAGQEDLPKSIPFSKLTICY
jgi:hypothetical protein